MRYSIAIPLIFLSSCFSPEQVQVLEDQSSQDQSIVETPENTSNPDQIDDDEEAPPSDSQSCNKTQNLSNIEKPTGVYTSVLTGRAVTNTNMQGGLVRVTWAEIEPSPGVFDFSRINDQLALLPTGKKWSLAVHGGWTSVNGNAVGISSQMSPSWLETTYNIETFEMSFRQSTVNMPKYWSTTIQNRLEIMMSALAGQYRNRTDLSLVYVPQMTSNGVEGHFNGVPVSTLLTAANLNSGQEDQFADLWVNASLAAAKIVARNFDNKAIAFEVHDVIDRTDIPKRIMDNFLTDSEFENRVGIAMWWLNGDDRDSAYQSELVEIIKNYRGDLYGQVIGNSSQDCEGASSCVDNKGKTWNGGGRFQNGGYDSVFTLAKKLCMRYIEPWNYEFENNTKDSQMQDFNQFASESFE